MLKKLVVFLMLFSFALSASAFAKEPKIGCLSLRKVFYEYKKTKEFNQKLEAEDAQIKEEIEKMTQEVRKLRDEIDLLSEGARKKKEPELREKVQKLDETRKKKLEEFLRKKDDMFKVIREDIMAVSAEYAKKNGYSIIFDDAVSIYFSKEYDITNDIIKQLNR